MAPRRPPIPRARPAALAAALLTASAMSLGGCAEMHRGAEAVGRIGGAPALAAADDAPAPARPDVKTVRPRGAPRPPASDAASEPTSPPSVVATAVPSPRQIFDFHPAGAAPDSWRQPFVINTDDGPLAADVHRSAAELKTFLADKKAGKDPGAAKVDGVRAGPNRKLCGEMDVASGKPGCAVPPAAAAAAR